MLFAANSRYQSIATTRLTLPDGTEIVYLKRRFVPQPERQALVREYVVVARDRLDNISARAPEIGDPELFWRICDANRALRPEALTEEIGRRLRITMPEGIPGVPGV
jgi:hypothetical protein